MESRGLRDHGVKLLLATFWAFVREWIADTEREDFFLMPAGIAFHVVKRHQFTTTQRSRFFTIKRRCAVALWSKQISANPPGRDSTPVTVASLNHIEDPCRTG
jgi:hypothetical protein